jgi:hypothetical protein
MIPSSSLNMTSTSEATSSIPQVSSKGESKGESKSDHLDDDELTQANVSR